MTTAPNYITRCAVCGGSEYRAAAPEGPSAGEEPTDAQVDAAVSAMMREAWGSTATDYRGIARAAIRAALAASPARDRDSERDAAARWREIDTLFRAAGVSWSVSHPRNEGDPYHFGFSIPMTPEEVLAAVERGGLGWAPALATAISNAAAVIAARRAEPHTGEDR